VPEKLGSKFALALVLGLCIARLWLMPLPSSFWVDEMVSAFVIHFGPSHPSLAVAPQVTETIYYWLPHAAESIFGFSEVVYRVPSLLVLGVALWLIAKLAARLIHPQAAWFAIFACLALKGFNYEAADARPYALGTCAAAASLWFLIRWLDGARRSDALLFTLFAALLWRVHLVFWPFYAIFAVYVAVRILHSETTVTWRQALGVFAILTLTLIPVAVDAIRLMREAQSHVIAELPVVRDVRRTLKFLLIAQCGGGAILAAYLLRRRVDLWKGGPIPALSSWVLILGWWLWHPVALFAFSHFTGNSVYVDRYLSLALPGAALTATLAAACVFHAGDWRMCSAVLGLCVLVALGQWTELWPVHHNSDWRAAARTVNKFTVDANTPVLLPSPFIEAKPPVWRPNYPLPGFLYCYLPVYKIFGKPYLLPFERSPEAERYAAEILPTLSGTSRFLIYGGDKNVFHWRSFFASRMELRGWENRQLHSFGDVDVAIFDNPGSARTLASR
jgi:Dolichyl-phosphate-mannose-protein mannosyltransferase